jgi:3-oxoacyl-[acyl-carrier-protein] synthase-3
MTRVNGRGASLAAVGYFVPPRVLTSAELADRLGVSCDWIVRRTGIVERHVAADDTATSDLAAEAAIRALDAAHLTASDLDAIFLATETPDMPAPAAACLVQRVLGAWNAWAVDIRAACSGFLFALVQASQFIAAGSIECALVVGADKMSSVVDWTDPSTATLFGDGAGAVLLQRDDHKGVIVDFCLGSDGRGAEQLCIAAGGSRCPYVPERQRGAYCVRQNGAVVFRKAVQTMMKTGAEVLARNALTPASLRYYIPHQSNRRIIDAAAEGLGVRSDQLISNVQRFGNTSAATIPIGLAEAMDRGAVEGDWMLASSFGAGFSWASVLLQV